MATQNQTNTHCNTAETIEERFAAGAIESMAQVLYNVTKDGTSACVMTFSLFLRAGGTERHEIDAQVLRAAHEMERDEGISMIESRIRADLELSIIAVDEQGCVYLGAKRLHVGSIVEVQSNHCDGRWIGLSKTGRTFRSGDIDHNEITRMIVADCREQGIC
jgi:hypothetical protein